MPGSYCGTWSAASPTPKNSSSPRASWPALGPVPFTLWPAACWATCGPPSSEVGLWDFISSFPSWDLQLVSFVLGLGFSFSFLLSFFFLFLLLVCLNSHALAIDGNVPYGSFIPPIVLPIAEMFFFWIQDQSLADSWRRGQHGGGCSGPRPSSRAS
jgi:hypothetical protein